MDNTPQNPQQPVSQPEPLQPAPQQQQQQQPLTPAPVPLQPVDSAKAIKTGWVLVVIAIVVTAVGLFLGFALVAAALLAAFGARLGLQNKNKALAATGLTIAAINLVLFALALFLN